jgi:hypothetical protein
MRRRLEDDWFKTNVRSCVGDGKNIGFWKFRWASNLPFFDLFPTLFAKEEHQDVMIADKLS